MHCVPCRYADCTIFIMVYGMTRSGDELTTYCMRGRHADSPGAVGWNLVLSDKDIFSLLFLVAQGLLNKNQEGSR